LGILLVNFLMELHLQYSEINSLYFIFKKQHSEPKIKDDNFALTRPGPNCPAPQGFYPPRRGGGVGTGQDFCPDNRGGAIMGIGTDSPRPAPTFNNITKILVFIIM
jgi:hypothetical protein